jgi:hypothetical protein
MSWIASIPWTFGRDRREAFLSTGMLLIPWSAGDDDFGQPWNDAPRSEQRSIL